MNQKEIKNQTLLTEEQKNNYANTVKIAYHKIQNIEGRGLIQVYHELIYDSGREVIRIVVDRSYIKAVKGGAYGAYRELHLAGEGDLAKKVLELARNAKV